MGITCLLCGVFSHIVDLKKKSVWQTSNRSKLFCNNDVVIHPRFSPSPPLSDFSAAAPGHQPPPVICAHTYLHTALREAHTVPSNAVARFHRTANKERKQWASLAVELHLQEGLLWFFSRLFCLTWIGGQFVSESQDEPNRHRIASSEMPVYKGHQGELYGLFLFAAVNLLVIYWTVCRQELRDSSKLQCGFGERGCALTHSTLEMVRGYTREHPRYSNIELLNNVPLWDIQI